jgi:putative N6-adenine-specific DNA methylase
MAEKHRFKKHREFKQRIEEQEQNEDADIRSFTFHRHEVFEDRKSRKTAYSAKPGKTGKPFKKRNRFDDDED